MNFHSGWLFIYWVDSLYLLVKESENKMRQSYGNIPIIILLFLNIVFIGCNHSKGEAKEPLSVQIDLLKEYIVRDSIYNYCEDTVLEYIDNKRYDIQIALENNSDTTVSVMMMTCSWNENIIINTPYIEHLRGDCNSNYPHLVDMKPHDRYVLTANLEKNKHIRECQSCPEYNQSIYLKMGLILIQSFNGYDSIMNDKSSWQIIWSNPIELNKRTTR